MKTRRAVVIGAGFAGLSVAPLLAKDGWDVTVVERHPTPGGRAMSFEAEGFRFDMGPSWYLMPEVFERFFVSFGRSTSDFYHLHRLDPAYQVFFPDQPVKVHSDLEAGQELFESFEPGGGEQFRQYVAQAKYQYDVAMDGFLYNQYKRPTDFFTWRLLREAPRLGLFSSLDTVLKKRFSNPKARQLLSYTSVFLGADPRQTPALYSLMSHVDFGLGVFYPMGGIIRVVDALHQLGGSIGVKYSFDTEVTGVTVRNGLACGVQTNRGEMDCDVVISGADYHHTETALLAPEYRSYSDRYWAGRTMAPSALLMYLGVSGKVENLEHHNLFLDADWYGHFDSIFRTPSWPKRPSYYICAPSKTDPSVAPSGDENLFVLVPVAPGLRDTSEHREAMAKPVMEHLSALTGTKLSERIKFRRFFAHEDFSRLFSSFKGSALGLGHTLMQSALFRPRRRSKKISNLFYTGHYTHPGIGVPMTIISSTLTAEAVRDFGADGAIKNR
jgi:phytoene desaturase